MNYQFIPIVGFLMYNDYSSQTGSLLFSYRMFVLRIITGKEDVTLVREETQKDFKRLVGARSVCLDVHGVDNEGRQHIIYVNGQYRGDDMLGDLMHDFCCSEPDEMKKEHPKGVEEMCKILEDMRRETAEKVCLEKIRIVMRKLKYTAQQAMEFLEIPDSEQKRYLAKL